MHKKRILIVICAFFLALLMLAGCNTESYTLTYELNGGLIEGQDSYQVKIKEDDPNNLINLRTPIRDGYDFAGWYVDGNLYEDDVILLDQNITISAKWQVIEYQISYFLDGGKLESSIDIYTCENEVSLPVPTKEGYTFLGWNEKLFELPKGTTGDLVLKAKWDLTNYTITYHLDGGVLANPITEFTYLEEVILKEPIKEGYKFRGWYLDKNMSGDQVVNIAKGTTNNIDVYASWALESDMSDITYNLNGGVFSSDIYLEYEHGKEFELAIPEKENYLFMGWYEEKDLSGDVIWKINSTDVGNKVYYASWLSAREVFDELIPTTVNKDLTFYKRYPGNEEINILWVSRDTRVISNLGVINQGHKNIDVDLKMTLSYGKSQVDYVGTVKVEPVVFEKLEQGKTTVGYVYAGSYSKWGSNKFENVFSKTALETMDVVNYGFATVTKAGKLKLDNTGFTNYLTEVLKLRKYGIRVLLCIGENSANFSEMASTQEGIDNFVSQVIEAVEKYHFDGVDIDWEFPGVDTGRDVSIDRPNFTKLIKALRIALDKAQSKNGSPYLLTAAIPGTSWGSERYEMNVLDEYLDYVNMMSYDLNNTGMACHHTSLYTSNDARAYGFSIQYGVDRFTSLGFDKNKIVIGMAFYGKYYTNATTLGANAVFKKNIVYTTIKEDYLSNSNFVECWDEVAKASYLINKNTGEFVSYDSPRSIKEKCNYAQNSGIMGVMFWDYSEDTTGDLIQAIKESMSK